MLQHKTVFVAGSKRLDEMFRGGAELPHRESQNELNDYKTFNVNVVLFAGAKSSFRLT